MHNIAKMCKRYVASIQVRYCHFCILRFSFDFLYLSGLCIAAHTAQGLPALPGITAGISHHSMQKVLNDITMAFRYSNIRYGYDASQDLHLN